MNILIVSATQFEVKPLLQFLEVSHPIVGLNKPTNTLYNDVHVLITGIGMVNTAYMMGKYVQTQYDLVINVGVCGAFDTDLKLGQLVNITEDVLSEMGAEDDEDFLTYDKLGLDGKHVFKNQYSIKNGLIDALPKVKGITVNTIHGNEQSIEKIKELYNPDVESMEGAAFFASCGLIESKLQIRAISNYVEKRDKSKWNMPLAIENLNEFIIAFIKK